MIFTLLTINTSDSEWHVDAHFSSMEALLDYARSYVWTSLVVTVLSPKAA